MIVLQHNLTIEQIRNNSLEKEIQAHDFYSQHATGCSIDCVRELLNRLADEESKHEALIRKMLARFESGKDVLS